MFQSSKREKDRAVKNLDRLKAIHKKLKVVDNDLFEKRLLVLEKDVVSLQEAEKLRDEQSGLNQQRWFVKEHITTALTAIEEKKNKRVAERRKPAKPVEFDDEDE